MQDEPQYVCIPPGTIVYVTTHRGTVEAVDLNTRQVLLRLLSGGMFGPMDYDASTGEVYVPTLNIGLLLFNTLLAKILPSAKQRLIPH